MITKGTINHLGTQLLHNGALIGTFITPNKEFRPSEIGICLEIEPHHYAGLLACADALAARLNTTAYVSRQKVTPTGVCHDLDLNAVRVYSDYADMIRDGQSQWMVRGEDRDLACNTIKIPKLVPINVGANKRVKKGEPGRHVAFLTLFGRRAAISTAKTWGGLVEQIVWDVSYSTYAPSTAYRAFRTLYGFEYGSGSYQTEEQSQDAAERGFKGVVAMAGGIP